MIEGILKGYDYLTEIASMPVDGTAVTASAETPSDDQPAAPIEQPAPAAAATDQPAADEHAASADPAAEQQLR